VRAARGFDAYVAAQATAGEPVHAALLADQSIAKRITSAFALLAIATAGQYNCRPSQLKLLDIAIANRCCPPRRLRAPRRTLQRPLRRIGVTFSSYGPRSRRRRAR